MKYGSPLALSPDGARIVSGKPLNVWDFATGQELLTLAGRYGSAVSVAFSPCGGRVASGCGLLKVWNVATGEELLTIDNHSTEPTARSIAFSPDGRWIAGLDGLDRIRLWDAWTGRKSGFLQGGATGNVVFSPDGRRIAHGTSRGATVWDLYMEQNALTLRANQVACLAYSPDGRLIAAATDTKKVKVWDANTGRELLLLEGHTGKITDVVFSPDGQRLASGDGRTVRLWDVEMGNELLTFQVTTTYWYPTLTFSPDGRQLVTGSQVWDADVTPESNLQRQAVSVLRFLFDKPLRTQDVVEFLQTDVSISEEVRKQASVFLDRYHEENDPHRYDEAAWAVVRQPYLCGTQYDFALRQTNAAVAVGGEKANYLVTRGAAQFRAGEYEEALATLRRSFELDKDQAFGLVFLALTQHRLGNTDEARQILEQFRQVISGQPWSDNVDAQHLLLEAGALIAPERLETRPGEPRSSQNLE